MTKRPDNDYQWQIWMSRFRAVQEDNRRLIADNWRLLRKIELIMDDVRAQAAISHALARRDSHGAPH